jgi:hypothetical protein
MDYSVKLPSSIYEEIEYHSTKQYLLTDDVIADVIDDLAQELSKASVPIPLQVKDTALNNPLPSPAIYSGQKSRLISHLIIY